MPGTMLIALYTLPHLILFLKKFLFFTILFKIFIEIQLIYNVVLLSGVQQSDSVIHIYSFSDSLSIGNFQSE